MGEKPEHPSHERCRRCGGLMKPGIGEWIVIPICVVAVLWMWRDL